MVVLFIMIINLYLVRSIRINIEVVCVMGKSLDYLRQGGFVLPYKLRGYAPGEVQLNPEQIELRNYAMRLADMIEAESINHAFDIPRVVDEDMIRQCPFCGGPASLHWSEPGHEDRVWCIIRCDDFKSACPGSSLNTWYPTKDEAIAAWNRRHERTCIPVWKDVGHGVQFPFCSECGGELEYRYPYCSQCGARNLKYNNESI